MPFDFGRPAVDMGHASIRALEGLASALVSAYGLSQAAAFQHAGVSSMNGRTDEASETVGLEDFQTIAAFAGEHHLGRLTFWSVNRDRPWQRSGRQPGGRMQRRPAAAVRVQPDRRRLPRLTGRLVAQSGQRPCRSKYSRARSSSSRWRSPAAPARNSQLMKKIAIPALTIPRPLELGFAAERHHDDPGQHDGPRQHVAHEHHRPAAAEEGWGSGSFAIRCVAGARVGHAYTVRSAASSRRLRLGGERRGGPPRRGLRPRSGGGGAEREHGAAARADNPPRRMAGGRQAMTREGARCRAEDRADDRHAEGLPDLAAGRGDGRRHARLARPACPRRRCR